MRKIQQEVAKTNLTTTIHRDRGFAKVEELIDLCSATAFEAWETERNCIRHKDGGEHLEIRVQIETWESGTIYGLITISQAGSVLNPWDAYDLTLIMFN